MLGTKKVTDFMGNTYKIKRDDMSNFAVTDATNRMNYQIASDANALNYKMFQEQNEYNSASAQRQRLEAAGLNPYLMLDGGDAGSAGSWSGAQAPTMQSFESSRTSDLVQKGLSSVTAAIQQGLDAYSAIASNRKSGAETLKILSEIPGINEDSRFKRVAANVAEATESDQIQQQHYSTQLMDEQVLGAVKDNFIKDVTLSNLPYELQWKIQLLKDEHFFNEHTLYGRLDAQKMITEIEYLLEQKYGQKLANKEKRLLMPYVVQSLKLQNEGQELQNEYQWFNNNYGDPFRYMWSAGGKGRKVNQYDGYRDKLDDAMYTIFSGQTGQKALGSGTGIVSGGVGMLSRILQDMFDGFMPRKRH